MSTKITISDLTSAGLLEVYNRWGSQHVKKFENRAIGERRVAALLAEMDDMPLAIAMGTREEANAFFAARAAKRTKRGKAATPAPVIPDNDGAPVVDDPAVGDDTYERRMAASAADHEAAEAFPTGAGEAAFQAFVDTEEAKAAAAPSASQPDPAAKPRRMAGVPKPGSKGGIIVALLSREQGATVDELMAATGWQSHTTRAYFVGLRRIGLPVARVSKGAYRIEAAVDQAA
jgi:hypothetical protein